MVNQYAPWKYVLLCLVVLLGILYAIPNLYGEDPAIQISHRVNLMDEEQLTYVSDLLKREGVEYRSIDLETGHILVRLDSEEQQLKAATQIQDILGKADKRYGVALNLAPATPAWLSNLNALPMYLGLDLRGGVHFLMEVDIEAAIEKSLERLSGELRTFLRGEKIRYKSVQVGKQKVSVRFSNEAARNEARLVLEDEYRDHLFNNSNDDKSWFVELSFSPTALLAEKKTAIEQNISTLRNRVNELGVAEPVIQRQGDDRVVVQLPGVQDTVRAKEILGATATLEFRLVHGSFTDWNAAAASGRAPIGTK